ncbi:MAG: AraC family transcriptional regulator [Clostridiales bacterium]|jgi:AraC-like DNA-binding protein|nr:AraC family transcriptional regulator [Clostridiales bacterium]
MDSFKHSFRSTALENLGLAVYNTGYQKCSRNHSWGPATRDHFLIHYVSSGKGFLHSGGVSYTLATGDLFLIFPGEISSYSADSDDPWEYYWVGFNGTEAKRLVNLSGFTKENPILRLADDNQVKSLLLNIYNSRGNTPDAEAKMTGYLYLFLGRLIHENEHKRAEYGLRDYLAQALRFIQYNYAGQIGVSDIADYVGISRSQLYRAFVSNFNISPNQFLQKYRLNEACSLLRDGLLTVSEVAGSVGFSDPLYFSRVFRKDKGMTPTEYQKKAAKPEQTADKL